MDSIIKIRDLTYEYENEDRVFSVLKGVSLDLKRGSFVAVLGHNGSGKSTLAKLLNGLNKPTSGTVEVAGMLTTDESHEIDIKKTVGMIFQNPDNQIVASIVEEDVAFGLENIGVPPDEMRDRVDAALKSVGMYEYRKSSPYNLSGGQKQRVAIAGVIAMEPQCIVLDEPTAMLDPQGRKDVISTLINLCREKGITVVLITHYMNEAALADRIVVLNNGKIELDGIPKDVFSHSKRLRELGLDIPQVTELAQKLNAAGINVPSEILTADECVADIIKAFSEG